MEFGDYSKFMLLYFIHLVIPTRQLQEIVSWNDDDAITHELLRMRITDLT
jgi:hypothetical protein